MCSSFQRTSAVRPKDHRLGEMGNVGVVRLRESRQTRKRRGVFQIACTLVSINELRGQKGTVTIDVTMAEGVLDVCDTPRKAVSTREIDLRRVLTVGRVNSICVGARRVERTQTTSRKSNK